jgi:glucoamylase
LAESSNVNDRMNDDLSDWIERQFQRSAVALARAISATDLIRRRAPFRQTVIPAKGSVLASPVIADWNPEPDYFFHWVRDSAMAMKAVAELMLFSPSANEHWRHVFDDCVAFSLALTRIDPAAVPAPPRDTTDIEFRKFLRSEAELTALSQDTLLGEPRFNPDGTVDFLAWSRPQFDGPALRALACLRYLTLGGALTDDVAALLRTDLAFTLRHAGAPCIGPWEEPGEHTHHYYVALVQLGALVHGKAWVENQDALQPAFDALKASLELHWSQRHRAYLAMRPAADAGTDAEDGIDAAALLAVLDADLPDGAHSALDSRLQETQDRIEAIFAKELPINHARPADCGPALGRNRADRYFGGGAWYATTLAAAAIYYRRALCPGQDAAALLQRGDRFMATVRWLTPDDGALSEQVDRVSGRQTSARHLTWSYAAFVNAACLRRSAMETSSGSPLTAA